MLNSFNIQGRLGGDVKSKELPSGATAYEFRIANSRKFKTKGGDRQEETSWFTVKAFDNVAAGIAKFLVKGKEVTVEGRIRTFEYEKDGEKKQGFEVVANAIHLGQDPQKGGGGSSNSGGGDDDAEVEDDKAPW